MSFFNHFESFISDNVKVAKTFISLIKLEAQLAGLSIYPLLLNASMLFVILITVWISAMVLLEFTIMLFTGNSLVAISLVLLLNLILFIILMKSLTCNLKKMSFEKTRETLKNKRAKADEYPNQVNRAN